MLRALPLIRPAAVASAALAPCVAPGCFVRCLTNASRRGRAPRTSLGQALAAAASLAPALAPLPAAAVESSSLHSDEPPPVPPLPPPRPLWVTRKMDRRLQGLAKEYVSVIIGGDVTAQAEARALHDQMMQILEEPLLSQAKLVEELQRVYIQYLLPLLVPAQRCTECVALVRGVERLAQHVVKLQHVEASKRAAERASDPQPPQPSPNDSSLPSPGSADSPSRPPQLSLELYRLAMEACARDVRGLLCLSLFKSAQWHGLQPDLPMIEMLLRPLVQASLFKQALDVLHWLQTYRPDLQLSLDTWQYLQEVMPTLPSAASAASAPVPSSLLAPLTPAESNDLSPTFGRPALQPAAPPLLHHLEAAHGVLRRWRASEEMGEGPRAELDAGAAASHISLANSDLAHFYSAVRTPDGRLLRSPFLDSLAKDATAPDASGPLAAVARLALPPAGSTVAAALQRQLALHKSRQPSYTFQAPWWGEKRPPTSTTRRAQARVQATAQPRELVLTAHLRARARGASLRYRSR